jgi:hypothetical protein
MTKIKNFRIHLRAREIARWLKNQRQMPTTPELELAVESAIKQSKAWVHPAAVYTTLTRVTAERATSLAFPDSAVAASIVAVTFGADVQAPIPADGAQASMIEALKEEALHQSVQFAIRLLQDQAKEEECELSAPVIAEDLTILSSLSTLLGSQRIGVSVSSESPAWPAHARLVWMYWTPVRRPSSKKSESSRTARAAA